MELFDEHVIISFDPETNSGALDFSEGHLLTKHIN